MTTNNTRVAVVTGGAGTMGTAIARALLADGNAVVLADIDVTHAEAKAAELDSEGNRAIAIGVDLSEVASIDDLVAAVADRFGRIDTLINNAAVSLGGPAPFGSVSIEGWELSMAVGLRAPMLLAQAMLPHWQQQRSGTIVNITSRAWAAGGSPTYASAKAGLVGLTRSMATQFAPLNVTANAVAPSFFASDFSRGRQTPEAFDALRRRHEAITPLGRIAEPEDVANAVAFLASPRASFITGEVLHVCGGSQLAPQP